VAGPAIRRSSSPINFPKRGETVEPIIVRKSRRPKQHQRAHTGASRPCGDTIVQHIERIAAALTEAGLGVACETEYRA
jgi:hypothetical protein